MKKVKIFLAWCILLTCVVSLFCVPNVSSADVNPLYSFDPLPAYSRSYCVGDTVYFGSYEQDNRSANGKESIAWTILEIRDDKALLLSMKVLDAVPYNKRNESVTWENCSLRKWLNNDFLTTAFTRSQIDQILPVTIENYNNDKYRIAGGRRTSDQVFVLSYEDALTYFRKDTDRQALASEYAQAQGVFFGKKTKHSWWWLRTPGKTENRACNVTAPGEASNYGAYVYSTEGGVRPAMWVYTNALS